MMKRKRTFISIKGDMDDLAIKRRESMKKAAELVEEYIAQATDNDIRESEIKTNIKNLLYDFAPEDRYEIMVNVALSIADEI